MKLASSTSHKLNGKYLRIAIILPRFNDSQGNILCENTHATLLKHGVNKNNIKLVRVPGALELPLTAKLLAKQKEYDAIIALGVVIKGETPHFDHVCTESQRGLMNVSLETELPIIFGIITALNLKQAMDRVQKNKLNKGKEFAQSAIEMATFVRDHLQKN